MRGLATTLLWGTLLALAACDETLPSCTNSASAEVTVVEIEPGLLQVSWPDQLSRSVATLGGSWQSMTLGGSDAAGGFWAITLQNGACLAKAWTLPQPAAVKVSEYLALPDGHLLVGGTLETGGGSLPLDTQAWIARYDPGGALVWQRTFGEFLYVSGLLEAPSQETVQSLTLLPDGGLAVAGLSSVNQAVHHNWVLLLDSQGIERQRLDLPRDNPRKTGSLDALVIQGSTWLLAGTLQGAKDGDLWLLSHGEEGFLWDRSVAAVGELSLSAATQGTDGWYLAGQQQRKAWLAAYGADDQSRWELWAAGEQNEGRFAALGINESLLAVGATEARAFALAVDQRGQRLWSFHETQPSAYQAVLPDSNGWLLAGDGQGQVLLRRLDEQGASRDWRSKIETN